MINVSHKRLHQPRLAKWLMTHFISVVGRLGYSSVVYQALGHAFQEQPLKDPQMVRKWYDCTSVPTSLKTLIIGRPVFFMCVIGDAGFQGDSSVQMSPDEMSPASRNYDHFCKDLARSTKIWTLFGRLKKKKKTGGKN